MSYSDIEPLWQNEPLSRLVDYLGQALHPEQLQTLQALFEAVADARRANNSCALEQLEVSLNEFRDELYEHQEKEEEMIFPLVRRAEAWSSASSITVMLREHQGLRRHVEEARQHLAAIHSTAENTLVWQRFLAFEDLFHFHMQLEEGVLFPRALLEGASSPAKPLKKAGSL